MNAVRTAAQVRSAVDRWHAEGLSIGFVPTMGALHDAHLALVRTAGERADRVVVSIFVNPTQFGPGEDFASYPRSVEDDSRLLEQAGCHLMFLPEVETIYPAGHSTYVAVGGVSEGLEGDHRPDHFRGVATVVLQLFNLVRPDLAVFGEKDAQQLAVIRKMARDLHVPVEVVGHPTVREGDGLAMSSRNAYLGPEERRAASVLSRALESARRAVDAGERNAAAVVATMTDEISGEPLAELDYAAVVDAQSFAPVERIEGKVTLPVAARVGRARLIDNISLEPSDRNENNRPDRSS